jgi:hypothetical protein
MYFFYIDPITGYGMVLNCIASRYVKNTKLTALTKARNQ